MTLHAFGEATEGCCFDLKMFLQKILFTLSKFHLNSANGLAVMKNFRSGGLGGRGTKPLPLCTLEGLMNSANIF